MRNKLQNYYAHHPERQGDERGRDAIRVSFDGVEEILRLIDFYEIRAPDSLPPLPIRPKA